MSDDLFGCGAERRRRSAPGTAGDGLDADLSQYFTPTRAGSVEVGNAKRASLAA